MATYNVTVVIADENSAGPAISGDKRGTIRRLRNHLRKMVSGTTGPGTNTLAVRGTAVAATGSVTCAAVAAADTVTINGVALTARQHYAKGTITCASVDALDEVVVGATTFVGTAGAVVLGAATFSVDGTDTQVATSLAAQINGHAVASTVVTATSALGVVTLRAVASGTAGNAIVLTSSDGTDLAVSGAGTLTNGTAVAANEFDMSFITDINTNTAAALAAAINASASALISGQCTATSSSAVVTITAKVPGVTGNAQTLATSNGTRLAITGGGSRLTGGSETLVSLSY